jgi:hypothetical protein
MDIINEHFNKHPQWPRPEIQCADGFTISVQAHAGAYCFPRPGSNAPREFSGPFTEVECGFPNGPVPELAEWKDGDGEDTDSVYGYVPISAVLALIEKHGGVKASD